MIDIITIHHNHLNKSWMNTLFTHLEQFEGDNLNLIAVDNSVDNRGFAKGCNYGASLGNAEFIGFINPDVEVKGKFHDEVVRILTSGADITGCRFGKPDAHLNAWGVTEWVCGAVFFTRRDHWDKMGGFDEGFVWSFEETDFVRRTQVAGGIVYAADLPFLHSHPQGVDSEEDLAYKKKHFEEAKAYYYSKWS